MSASRSAVPRFATQLVGSWSKPQWLCDHDRVYGPEGSWWRIPEPYRHEAMDDAVRLSVFDQLRAGLSYIGDGEQRRQTFSGHFYALGGIDQEHPGAVTNFANDVNDYLTMKKRAVTADAAGKPAAPPKFEQPRVIGPITWDRPILDGDLAFLRSTTDRPVKMTVIGPSTLALRLVDEHYGSLDALTIAVADALNQELLSLDKAGVDLIQIDEPEVHFRYSQVEPFAAEAIDRALAGIASRTAVHVCYGYARNIAEKRATPVYAQALELLASTTVDAISLEYEQPRHAPELLEHAGAKDVILGTLDLGTDAPVEDVPYVVDRVRAAVEVLGPDRVGLAPDCGMWFLPRDHARAKIAAMEQAAQALRESYA